MFEYDQTRIILASGSKARADLLENTGLSFEICPADIDEVAIREVFKSSETDPADIAEILAESKAMDVSKKDISKKETTKGAKEALVIGCDQILTLGNEIFEKPSNKDEVYNTLFKLRGKTHTLISAIVIVEGGNVIWRYSEQADLKMHEFSPEFLGQYLALCGDKVLSSVGAYHLESFGVHLFEEIKGDYFTILGLPVIALLKFLRKEGHIQS